MKTVTAREIADLLAAVEWLNSLVIVNDREKYGDRLHAASYPAVLDLTSVL